MRLVPIETRIEGLTGSTLTKGRMEVTILLISDPDLTSRFENSISIPASFFMFGLGDYFI